MSKVSIIEPYGVRTPKISVTADCMFFRMFRSLVAPISDVNSPSSSRTRSTFAKAVFEQPLTARNLHKVRCRFVSGTVALGPLAMPTGEDRRTGGGTREPRRTVGLWGASGDGGTLPPCAPGPKSSTVDMCRGRGKGEDVRHVCAQGRAGEGG